METADPRLEDQTGLSRSDGASHPDNLLLHHFSIGSRASRVAFALPTGWRSSTTTSRRRSISSACTRLLVELCFLGRRELGAYVDRCEIAVGDSEFNRQELAAIGFASTGVLPVVPDFSHLDCRAIRSSPPTSTMRGRTSCSSGGSSRTRRIEDLIRIFAAYKRAYNPAITPAHRRLPRRLREIPDDAPRTGARLGVTDLHMTGHVTNAELAACYDVADVFLCASEHEGFCVPLMEAFHARVPVIAYAATAVPATMDGGGILYRTAIPMHVAGDHRRDRLRRRAADRVVASQDAALERLRNKDFAGTLLATSSARWRTRRGPARVAFDFWDQFTAYERLKELQRFGRGSSRRCRTEGRGTLVADNSHIPTPNSQARRTTAAETCREMKLEVGSWELIRVLINQWLPAAHRGDAVGDSTRRVRDLLRAMGHESHIYALTIDDDMKDEARPFDHADARRGDITVYHFAVPSPMSGAFRDLPRGRVLQYHNITPAHFFADYDPGIFRVTALGRTGAGVTRDGNGPGARRFRLQPSGARHARLRANGRDADCRERRATDEELLLIQCSTPYSGMGLPISCSSAAWRQTSGSKTSSGWLRPSSATVTRVPFHLRRANRRRPGYYATVRALVAEYKMLPERFWFTGPVSDWELPRSTGMPASYLSMSEHEGFCVPLVEAMATDVPVLAYAEYGRAGNARRLRRRVRLERHGVRR